MIILLKKPLLLFMVFVLSACFARQADQNLPAVSSATDAVMPVPAGTSVSTIIPGEDPTMITVPVETATIFPVSQDFWKDLPVVPLTISDRAREIYQRGLIMGNDPHAFSKVGDCHSTNPYFLADFDNLPEGYELGEYTDLQSTIDYYNGSFGRTSLAAKQGLSTAGVLASLWSDWKQCNSNETPLDCEFRIHRPSFAIISLGTNEAYDVKLDRAPFEGRLRRIIEHSIDQGVVPILSTKADNDEGDHYINYVTAKLAHEYELPLWNFWKAMQPLPDQGMRSADHLTFAPTKSYADFSKPEYLEYGMQMRNLTALQMLDMIRREIGEPQNQFAVTSTPQPVSTSDVLLQAGESMVSSVDGMTLVYIPAGTFEMGSSDGNPDEAPVHTVALDGYWMDSTEVTNVMFVSFLNAKGNQMEGGTDWLNQNDPYVQVSNSDGIWQYQPGKGNYPIVGVSWYGANAYCAWAGRRLPTETEWEYAAKGMDNRRFPWGDKNLDCNLSRHDGCGSGPVEAGTLPLGASPFGIFDLAGNVSEWINDRYAENYYQVSPLMNPTGPINGYYRVVRGGFWASTYIALQTTHRDWAGADERDAGTGFRCALTP